MAIIDQVELNSGLTKISIYKQEEYLNLNELEIKLNQLSSLYNTSNLDKLNNINFELKNKFNKINRLHNSYIEIINRTVSRYQTTIKLTENILSNINTSINTDVIRGDINGFK